MHFMSRFFVMLLGIAAIAMFLVMLPFFGLTSSFIIAGAAACTVYLVFLRSS